MTRRLPQLCVGIAVSSVVVVFLAHTVDTHAVFSTLAAVDPRLVLTGVAVHIFAMYVRSLLWQRLLAAPASTSTLFRVSIVGFAVSYLMPLRVGEIARAYLLARWRGIAYSTTLASLVAERVLDGLCVGAILLVALLFAPAPDYVLAFGFVVVGIFGALASALVIASWRARAFVTLAASVASYLPARAGTLLLRLASGFAKGLEPLRNWRALPALIGLALVGWLCQFAVFYMVMLALPVRASIPVALIGGGLANFATLLPSGPASVGTFDGALIKLLMDMQGTSLENATAYALVVHAVVVVPIVLLGAAVMWRSGLTLHQLLSRRNTPQRSTSVLPI
jgi:uncharacterized protein (TIRG00374 family)